jgi:hyperosmotically inducible periplasmic protein
LDPYVTGPADESRTVQEVRHQLVMLPYYSVFDDLAFNVNGGTVTLLGEVTKPVLKEDAGKVVQKVEGVTNVINNIEVLPLSGIDDHGNVRLEGVVANEMDRSIAFLRANGVPGAFHVDNDLKVEAKK